jgi:hypothetical protein
MRCVCICIGVAASTLVTSPAQAAHPSGRLKVSARGVAISTRATPTRLPAGHKVTVAGMVTGRAGPIAGQLLELQLDRSRHGKFINAAHTVTIADGDYRFSAVRVYGDYRFRVVDMGVVSVVGPTVEVVVTSAFYPSSQRVRIAIRYLAGRAGSKAFAVADGDRLSGVNVDRRFHSASVVKSMLLVAYLQLLADQHRSLEAAGRELLYPMIHSSNNQAASAVLAIVGEERLDRVARDAHMRDYESGGGFWGFTEVSAADLARFFLHQDALIPRRFDGYARWLLSTIEPDESWGIPAVARPEFHVFFKGGWLPEVEGLVNQAARLERPGIVFALSVLTVHDPSMAYGEQTIEGVTARLLGHAARTMSTGAAVLEPIAAASAALDD